MFKQIFLVPTPQCWNAYYVALAARIDADNTQILREIFYAFRKYLKLAAGAMRQAFPRWSMGTRKICILS
jgi:hypothetical protein